MQPLEIFEQPRLELVRPVGLRDGTSLEHRGVLYFTQRGERPASPCSMSGPGAKASPRRYRATARANRSRALNG